MVATFTAPVTRAYLYLSKRLPGLTIEREEEATKYEPTKPLLIIKSAGGNGAHTIQLFNARLTFEVRAETMKEAETLAYQVEKNLREWQWEEDNVYLRSPGIPLWSPEPDRRIPAYLMTFDFDFKGIL